MYIVYQTENHRDRIVYEIYGPFADEQAAKDFSHIQYSRNRNWNGTHPLYDFEVRELTSPESVL